MAQAMVAKATEQLDTSLNLIDDPSAITGRGPMSAPAPTKARSGMFGGMFQRRNA